MFDFFDMFFGDLINAKHKHGDEVDAKRQEANERYKAAEAELKEFRTLDVLTDYEVSINKISHEKPNYFPSLNSELSEHMVKHGKEGTLAAIKAAKDKIIASILAAKESQ